MSRCAISNICSDKPKVNVTLQGQILKFLEKGLIGRGLQSSCPTCCYKVLTSFISHGHLIMGLVGKCLSVMERKYDTF